MLRALAQDALINPQGILPSSLERAALLQPGRGSRSRVHRAGCSSADRAPGSCGAGLPTWLLGPSRCPLPPAPCPLPAARCPLPAARGAAGPAPGASPLPCELGQGRFLSRSGKIRRSLVLFHLDLLSALTSSVSWLLRYCQPCLMLLI